MTGDRNRQSFTSSKIFGFFGVFITRISIVLLNNASLTGACFCGVELSVETQYLLPLSWPWLA
jgi:hypothetical protein